MIVDFGVPFPELTAYGAALTCAGCLGVLSATPLMNQSAPDPPPLLAGLLASAPAYRLLDPAVDLLDDYTVADLRALKHWPPWVEADLDHDARIDVAAVIVEAVGGASRFGIVAVHARNPTTPVWIVPLGEQRLYAAYIGDAPDVVVAAHCLECDTNGWYRWNGRAYEATLYAVGETVTIGETEQRGPVRLFEGPRDDAPRTGAIDICVAGRVSRVVGRPGARWYLVEVDGGTPARGWVPGRYLTEAIDCVG